MPWMLYELYVVNRPWRLCSITQPIACKRRLATGSMAGPRRGRMERPGFRWRPRQCTAIALGIVAADVGLEAARREQAVEVVHMPVVA